MTFFRPVDDALLQVPNLRTRFATDTGTVQAVGDAACCLRRAETLGIVGQSGCGKSTLARRLLGLDPATSGDVFVEGMAQMIFQDPVASFNPEMTVDRILSEPLEVRGRGTRAERVGRVGRLLAQVGLDPFYVGRCPGQLSGGQRQRVAIERAGTGTGGRRRG
ncbi:ATP-binding cassette domain-containing protein [Frigidibacter sp. MR17.14]|uniref:ATP-binding cassette domain-containing protein n=1 Tax=Frigidibacter sp. MR17.14 TaxID=3126509 RepID=UPI003012EA7D